MNDINYKNIKKNTTSVNDETELQFSKVEGKITMKTLRKILNLLEKNPDLFVSRIRSWMNQKD
jgi:flagellar biosynthesis/type III secretory pathway M-ring protein FliF/YscJ